MNFGHRSQLWLARYDFDISGNSPRIEFDDVLKAAVADLLPTAQDKLIDLGFARIEPVSIRIEPVALSALARNLVDNALKHSPSGGRVDLSLFAEGEFMIFKVEDTGSGIPEADLDRVLEPFFRGSHSRGEGTGLGLSIVRRIVHQCRGSIQLQNKPTAEGFGLRVTVRLPRN